MLTKSMQRNPKVRVVVFDPDVDVVQKLRRQLTLRIPHFDSKRVIRVSGDCAATLPAIPGDAGNPEKRGVLLRCFRKLGP